MPSHERFEELCVLAAAGEISPADREELMAHVGDCGECRNAFEELKEIHATWLPERSGFEIKRDDAAESRLRQSILRRATVEGARFSREARSAELSTQRPAGPWYAMVGWRALAAVAVVVLAVVSTGIVAQMNRWSSQSNSLGIVRNANPVPQTGASEPSAEELAALRAKAVAAQEGQEKAETALATAEKERTRLEQELRDSEGRGSALEQAGVSASGEVLDLRSQLEVARAGESKAEQQLSAMKASTAVEDGQLQAAELENKDLREKLNEQTASVDRERELMSAGREIRDLIAARNLHIIDVYDTNGEGKMQKSFGRVFYTEGKSLVFYAYDLPRRIEAAKYAFYAWGKKDGNDVQVRNLGIFYSDDQAQKRWVLEVTDPQALSEIDSVFVTLERKDPPGKSPTGKKLLSAYLGTPANHP